MSIIMIRPSGLFRLARYDSSKISVENGLAFSTRPIVENMPWHLRVHFQLFNLFSVYFGQHFAPSILAGNRCWLGQGQTTGCEHHDCVVIDLVWSLVGTVECRIV